MGRIMRYVQLKIVRDTNTVYPRSVPEWEVPVLEFIFEEGNVQRTGSFEKVTHSDYPDASAEFDRLMRAYGADPQSGVPYVAAVYGNASAGIRALAKAIEAAKAEGEETAASEPEPVQRRRAKAASRVDSLLG